MAGPWQRSVTFAVGNRPSGCRFLTPTGALRGANQRARVLYGDFKRGPAARKTHPIGVDQHGSAAECFRKPLKIVEVVRKNLNLFTERIFAFRVIRQCADPVSTVEQNARRVFPRIAERSRNHNSLIGTVFAFCSDLFFVAIQGLLLCSRLFRFCELCAVCVESTVLPVGSLRFGANVFQHTEMDLVNDVIRPQMPILCRPHRVVIPGRTFQASAPAG